MKDTHGWWEIEWTTNFTGPFEDVMPFCSREWMSSWVVPVRLKIQWLIQEWWRQRERWKQEGWEHHESHERRHPQNKIDDAEGRTSGRCATWNKWESQRTFILPPTTFWTIRLPVGYHTTYRSNIEIQEINLIQPYFPSVYFSLDQASCQLVLEE